jgi:iron complex transport system ATP-binding protein
VSDLSGERVTLTAGGRLLLDGIDVAVRAGSVTALIGPNGAGKSTLLRALAALEAPASGTVRFGTVDAATLSGVRRARIAALVEQDANTDLDLRVEDVVALGRLPHEGVWGGPLKERERIVEESLDAVGMSGFRGRRVPSLSGGERQRVLLAKALAQRTPLLLLDEPTNHLDIAAQLSTLGLLRRLSAGGATVLAALHDLGLAAAFADDVVVLAGGRVAASGPVASTLTPALIRDVYDVDAVILPHPTSGRPVLALDLPEIGGAEREGSR